MASQGSSSGAAVTGLPFSGGPTWRLGYARLQLSGSNTLVRCLGPRNWEDAEPLQTSPSALGVPELPLPEEHSVPEDVDIHLIVDNCYTHESDCQNQAVRGAL